MPKTPSLHEVLTDAFPNHRTVTGVLDIPGLGIDLGLSHEGVYKWVRHNNLPARRVKQLIELSRPTKKSDPLLTVEAVLPFVIG